VRRSTFPTDIDQCCRNDFTMKLVVHVCWFDKSVKVKRVIFVVYVGLYVCVILLLADHTAA